MPLIAVEMGVEAERPVLSSGFEAAGQCLFCTLETRGTTVKLQKSCRDKRQLLITFVLLS